MELISHPAFADLHPSSARICDERPERLAALHERFPDFAEGRPATARTDRARALAPAYVDRIDVASRAEVWLDPDTYAGPTTWEAALLAAGCAIEAVETGGFALVRPPGHHALAAPRWGSASSATSRSPRATPRPSSASSASRSSTSTSTTGTGPRRSSAATHGALRLAAPVAVLPGHRRAGDERRAHASTSRSPRARGTTSTSRRSRRSSSPRCARFEPDLVLVSAGFDAHVDDPLAQMRVTADGFRELARRCAALAPRVAADARRRLQPRDAAGPRRGGARGVRRG